MDEHVESGSTLGEPGESDSEQDLARGTDLNSPSPGVLRQPASQERSTLQRDLAGDGAAGLAMAQRVRQPEDLDGQIEEAVERRFQKAKDRRLSRLEREVEELREIVALNKAAADAPPAAAVSAEAAQPPERPAARASHVIQPSGGGLPPAPDLRAEYEKRVAAVRPGDVAGLMEIKREFRKKGLEVY